MTTDENIMDEMLNRATNPNREPDELSLQMFCMVVRSNTQLVDKALDKIVVKIRSSDVTEATRTIALLEESMTKCGGEFQDEVSKFRFLNQLIRLVSSKYQGAETPAAIKQRIMECLLLWTTEFPQRTKIREVYDMLRKEGDVGEHGNSPAAVAKRESVLGIDEAMLSKLIKSGDPENFKRANLLIQYRVNQESRRTDLILQQKNVLQEVNNTVGLLNQMLDTYETDGGSGEAGDGNETVNLIRELFMACKKHKPILQRLPELIENSDEDLIADTLDTNDLLLAVMKRYKNAIVHASATKTPTTTTSLTTNNADLLTALLEDAPTTLQSSVLDVSNVSSASASSSVTPLKTTAPSVKTTSNTLDELHDIFGDALNATDTKADKNLGEIFDNLDLLEPVNVFTHKENGVACAGATEKRAFRDLPEIDRISEDLFKKSLSKQERVGSFKKEPEKYSLNDLAKEKMQVKPSTPTKSLLSEQQSFVALTEDDQEARVMLDTVAPFKNEDDLMLSTESIGVLATQIHKEETETVLTCLATTAAKNELPFKHLADIVIDLDDVTPTSEERVLLEDDDIKLTFNFTEDHPSKNISVIVISASNKSKMSLKDFHFEASVKKPCKVRLLPATDNVMPPHKAFRPVAPINQVLLLLNPTGGDIDVTCIVGYKLGDDPDEIKESIVAKNIPYVV